MEEPGGENSQIKDEAKEDIEEVPAAGIKNKSVNGHHVGAALDHGGHRERSAVHDRQGRALE